jgi:hypothetical protein
MEIWLLEQDLAKKIGVARDVVAEYRKAHLQRDKDWRIERKQVELSQDAIDKISTALGASTADPAHNTAPPQAVEITVLRLWPNPRLLQAKTAEGELVRVWVPKNKNFRPGMKIKARPPANGSFQYTLEGRCPRYPGRW